MSVVFTSKSELTENVTESGVNITTTSTHINESIGPPVIQFLTGLAGNIAAVILLIVSSKEHKWRPFYRLVGILILSDLTGIVLIYPIALSRYISNFTFEFPPSLCRFVAFMLTFIFMSSASIVCAMSFDRFLAILFPLKYSNHSKNIRIHLTVVGIWIVTGIICSLSLIGLGSVRSFYPGSWCFINFASTDAKDRANTYIYATVGLMILTAVVILNSLVIFAVCRKYFHDNKKGRKDDVFIVIYLLAVVLLFTVCWTPLMIRMLKNASSDNPDNGPLDLLAVRLSVANVIIDPYIYLLLRKRNFVVIARLFRSIINRFGIKVKESETFSDDTNKTNECSGQSIDTGIE